jgi:hypothetical protein
MVDGRQLAQIGFALNALNAPIQRPPQRQIQPRQFVAGKLYARLLAEGGKKLVISGSAEHVPNVRTLLRRQPRAQQQ